MWWMAVATATTLVSAERPLLSVAPTPHGDVAIMADFVQSVQADDTVVMTPVDVELADSRCDFDGNGWPDLMDIDGVRPVVASFTDLQTGSIVHQLRLPTSAVIRDWSSMSCADVDGDGRLDVIAHLSMAGQGWVVALWDADGRIRHWEASPGMRWLAQLDTDPALEVLNELDGTVRDGATWALQAPIPDILPVIATGDVDHDGIDDLLMDDGSSTELRTNAGGGWTVAQQATHGLMEDFDGDGELEVVLTTASDHVTVLDAVTGQTLRSGPGCRVAAPIDHDGDGVSEVLCSIRRQTLYDPRTGNLRLLRGQGHLPMTPEVGDIDGDGIEEVLWRASRFPTDRAVLRDAEGGWLDMFPELVDDRTRLVDVDGDGDMEIVNGVRAWDWSPSTGLQRLAPVLTTTADVCVHAIEDLDNDGIIEVFAKECLSQNWFVLDLVSGARIDLRPAATMELADLDGDGITEIIAGPALAIYHPDGTLWPTNTYTAFTLASHRGSTRVVTDARTDWTKVRVWSWDGTLRQQQVVSLPVVRAVADLDWHAGHLVYPVAGTQLAVWSPFSGALRRYPGWAAVSAEGQLWVEASDGWTAYPL